jgi:hypothetical protein
MTEVLTKHRPLRSDHAAGGGARRGGGRSKAEATRNQTLDDQLEQGLKESFPGSDPVAVTQPPHSHHDKGKP